jgi:hypothetical protein
MAHPPGHGGDDWAAAIVIVNEREIVARIRALLGSSRAHSVVAVGEGSDHWAFDVDGLFIARARKHRADDDASGIDREVALLDIVARVSPVPVPQVVASEPEAGLMVYRRLLADPANDVGRLVRDFGFAVGHTVLRRIGGDEIMLARATFHARCSLLEDLAYGVHTSRPQYVSHALARFSETFS